MKLNEAVNRAARIKYSDIIIGAVYSFEKEIAEQDVAGFAQLTGDFNPLHVDKDFGKKSQFEKNIVHGMLLGSLFSTLIGMFCPGEKGLYISQNLNFKLPVFYGDVIKVKGTVVNKNDSIKLLTIKTEILKLDKVMVTGEAKVKVVNDE